MNEKLKVSNERQHNVPEKHQFGKHIVSAPKVSVCFCQECITVIGTVKKIGFHGISPGCNSKRGMNLGEMEPRTQKMGGDRSRQWAELSLFLTN